MNRLTTMTDDELGAALAALGTEIAWPDTTHISESVGARIATLPAPRRRRRLDITTLWSPTRARPRSVGRSLVLAVLVLLAAVALATAVGIGVPGIRIFFGPVTLPSPTLFPAASPPAASATGATPALTPAPQPTSDPTLGSPVSLAQARAGAGFDVRTPTHAGFETPEAVHLLGVPPLSRVTLSYHDGGSVTEFIGAVDPVGFQKMVGRGTTVVQITLDGGAAYWISGAPHELLTFYTDGDGVQRFETTTVDANVLIWQHGEVTLRLVTHLGLDEATAIAESMR